MATLSSHSSYASHRSAAGTKAKGMRSIPALFGMMLALLGLFCIVWGTMQGANIFLALLGCLLAIRLFILCYGSFHTSLRHNARNTMSTSLNEGQDFSFMASYSVPPVSQHEPVFATAGSSISDALPSYPIHEASPEMPYYQPHSEEERYVSHDRTPRILDDILDDTYVPIEQDELFHLDTPTAGEYILYVPEEGTSLVECQDRFALNARCGRYAIAEGVSGSFASGSWASIIARGFVEYGLPLEVSELPRVRDIERTGQFLGERYQFEQWLSRCRNTWHTWIKQRWVPTMDALRAKRGDDAINWNFDIEHGAQTTLAGCQLRFRSDPADPYIDVYVSIIGNSECFLFRRNTQNAWECIAALPFIAPGEFNTPLTVLATSPQSILVEPAWTHHQEGCVAALPGDCVVLATDTLAKWILMQLQNGKKDWTVLLDSTDKALHEQMLRYELHENRIENDDVTMLVIPIAPHTEENG